MQKELVHRIATFLQEKEVKKFLVIFYFIGLAGMLVPQTSEFFRLLTPWALLLNFFLLAWFHTAKFDKKSLLVFLGIFLSGFIIESVGVNTKIIFGNYSYGATLGSKIWNTPLIIGLNWLFLAYTTCSLVSYFISRKLIIVLVSSLLMVVYDVLMEQIAPNLKMWFWNDGFIPLQNYVAWFFTSILFTGLLQFSNINLRNPIAGFIFCCQFLFFVFLYIFIKFSI